MRKNNIPTILFRVNASRKTGTGHVYECLWLARELRAKIIFCVNPDRVATKLVRQFGFPLYLDRQFASLIEKVRPKVIIFDIVDIKQAHLKIANRSGAKIVVLNALKNPIKADVQIATVFAPHPQNRQYSGGKYVLLKPSLRELRPGKIRKRASNIFIMFGGADDGNFTLKSLRALALVPGDFRISIVIGSANKNYPSLSRYLKTFPKPYKMFHNIRDERKLASLMRTADLALVSGGYTALEFMYLGVPVIALAQNEVEHKYIFSNFPKDSFMFLGFGRAAREQKIAAAIKTLISSYPKRLALGARAGQVVDGRGISRVRRLVNSF